MKLAFVTDSGFYNESGKDLFSTANFQHIKTMNKHFKEIVIVAQKTNYDGTSLCLPYSNELILLENRGMKSNQRIKKVVIDCDILICFGFNGVIAQHYAKKYNKPTIFYVGGCVYDTWFNIGSKKKRYAAPIIKKVFQKAIFNSQYVQYVDKYLKDTYPSQAKTLICPSAYITLDTESMEKRLSKSVLEKYKIGLIGYTHNKIKGIDTAIESLKYLNLDVELEIVGRGNTEALMNRARELGVDQRVKFLGVISDRDKLYKWFESLDVYLQPSLTEGLPRATLEAMSTGCPIISTSAGGLKTIVPKNQRIEFGDYKDLAEKIMILLSDQKYYFEVIETTLEIASKFTFDKLDFKRDKFYSEIVGDLNEK